MAEKSIFTLKGQGYLNSDAWCSLDWINDRDFNASRIAKEFRRAGDKIVDSILQGSDPYHPDGLFIPVAYLYRHALELKLKRLLELFDLTEIYSKSNYDNSIPNSHNLVNLWSHVKKGIKERWPNENHQELKKIDKLIDDFHKIDKTGQNLRYSHDRAGNRTIDRYPIEIDLGEFKGLFSSVFDLLDGCDLDLEAVYEWMMDNRDN